MFFGLPKNLASFFQNSKIPPEVIINLVSGESSLSADNRSVKKFVCHSVILALHSEAFRRIIAAGTEEIKFLVNSNSPVGMEVVRHSIEFMYGDQSAVYRVDDFIGMCKLSDVWDIPSLWVACLARIKCNLSDQPLQLFEYCQLLNIVSDKNWQHEDLWHEFDKTTKENADILITHIMKLPVLEEIDKRICKGLIKNSTTAICGQYLISLSSDELKEFVLLNLQLIPVTTAFASEADFIKFKSYFLPWECDQLDAITDEFYKHYQKNITILEGSADTLAMDHVMTNDVDVLKDGDGTVYFSLSSSDNVPKATTLSDIKSTENKGSVLNTSKKQQMQDKVIRTERTRMRFFAAQNSEEIPLSEYPEYLKKFPLYTGLDIVGHFISESSYLRGRNLRNLLIPFFQNQLIPASILNDIKAIAFSKCNRPNMIESLDDEFQGLQVSDRIETFAMTWFFENIELFCTILANEKKIKMQFEEDISDISCPVNRSSTKNESHGLYLDFSNNSCIKFVSLEDCQSKDIIHCYILVMSKTGNYQSYIPILQLTIPQIIFLVRKCSSDTSIHVKIIFSKTSELRVLNNVVAKCLQSSASDSVNKIKVNGISVTSHPTSKKRKKSQKVKQKKKVKKASELRLINNFDAKCLQSSASETVNKIKVNGISVTSHSTSKKRKKSQKIGQKKKVKNTAELRLFNNVDAKYLQSSASDSVNKIKVNGISVTSHSTSKKRKKSQKVKQKKKVKNTAELRLLNNVDAKCLQSSASESVNKIKVNKISVTSHSTSKKRRKSQKVKQKKEVKNTSELLLLHHHVAKCLQSSASESVNKIKLEQS